MFLDIGNYLHLVFHVRSVFPLNSFPHWSRGTTGSAGAHYQPVLLPVNVSAFII